MPSAKVASLTALCLHYSILTVVMHISRTSTAPVTANGEEPERYKASSAVVVTELGKLLISIGLAAREIRRDVQDERDLAEVDGFLRGEGRESIDLGGKRDEAAGLAWEQKKKNLELDRRRDERTSDAPPVASLDSFRGSSVSSKRRSVNEPRSLALGHARTSSATVRVSITPPSQDVQPPSNTPSSRHSPQLGRNSLDAPRDQTLGLVEEETTYPPLPGGEYDQEPPSIGTEVWRRMKEEVFQGDWWKLAVPAVMFVVQNNLQYVAASNLSVPLFQITYQLKILTTALCSVFLLNRTLYRSQWIALLFLTLGVAAVQLHAATEDHPSSASEFAGESALQYAAGSTHFDPEDKEAILASLTPQMNQLLGLLAVILACMSSGFASVYFERVLKDKSRPTINLPTPPRSPGYPRPSSPSAAPLPPLPVSPGMAPTGFGDTALRDAEILPSSSSASAARRKLNCSIWIRNIQLSIFGLAMGMFIVSFEGNKERLISWGQDLSLWYWENLAADEDWGTHRMASLKKLGRDRPSDHNADFWASTLAQTYTPALLGMFEEFFVGFTPLVWLVVALQVLGGLLNALVIQHADNILKGFCTAISILLSFVASMILFNFRISFGSVLGGLLVLGATWLYNQPQNRLPRRTLGLNLGGTARGFSFLNGTAANGDTSSGLMEGWRGSTDKTVMGPLTPPAEGLTSRRGGGVESSPPVNSNTSLGSPLVNGFGERWGSPSPSQVRKASLESFP